MDFLLADGRRLTMCDLHLLDSYSQAEDLKDLRAALGVSIPELVRRFYPGAQRPFVIRWPERRDLPPSLCIASFSSEPVAVQEPGGGSGLTVCWFTWHVDRHLRDIVESGLAGLRWAEHAQDFAWW